MTDAESGTGSQHAKWRDAPCAFCDNESEDVLTVVDPAPPGQKSIEGVTDLPVCGEHIGAIGEGSL